LDTATDAASQRGGTVITAMQYVAIAMPQMQSQVDLIEDSYAQQERCKERISELAQRGAEHAEAACRLQHLQDRIRKVRHAGIKLAEAIFFFWGGLAYLRNTTVAVRLKVFVTAVLVHELVMQN
jgi:hypothetical protein